MASFSAQVSDWVFASERRIDAVRKESAQRVATEVRDRTRKDTGFLVASFVGSTSAMPLIERDARPEDGKTYQIDEAQIELVIAGSKPTDTLYMGFTASYAAPREYIDGMVRLAAQQWYGIVRQVSIEAQARSIRPVS